MKTANKVIVWLDAGIFPATICFCSGFSYDEIMADFKKKKADQWTLGLSKDKELIDSGNYFALKRSIESSKSAKEVSLFYIIITDRFRFSDHEICKLAHEVLHICQFMLKDILDMERECEAVAYTHTYIMENCLKELRSKK